MTDGNETRAQLIQELRQLRRRVAELEGPAENTGGEEGGDPPQARWERARRQRAAIAELVLDDAVVGGDTPTALRRITRVLAQTVDVERASVWTLSEDGSELECQSLFEATTGEHTAGTTLQTGEFPRYFEAILAESRIYAGDAQADPRTSELTEGYLAPLGITSLLDAGVVVEGQLLGVVSLEHVGETRRWYADEEALASTAASITAQVFVTAERRRVEEQRQFQVELQRIAAQSSAALSGTVSDSEFDRAVNTTLRRLGELHSVDRSYLVRFSEGTERMTNTHEWCAAGVEPQMHRIQDQATDDLPWWKERMLEQQPLEIPDVAELPPELEAERWEFSAQGIRSLLCLPTVGAHGHLSGFMGFDAVRSTYRWSPELITVLQLVADAIGSALERRTTVEALQKSEEKYRTLFDQSAQGIYLHDLDGNILDVNEMACRQSGYDRDELLQMRVFDLHPDRAATVNLAEPEILRQWRQWQPGERSSLEAEHQRKDGTVYPVEVSTGVIHYHDSLRVLALVQDITARKRAEAELRDERRFLSLLNDVTRATLETTDMPSMLQILADELGGLFGADACSITFWDEESQLPIPMATSGEWRDRYRSLRPRPDEPTMTEAVLRAGRPLAVENVFETPHRSRRLATMFPTRSLLALPLIGGDDELGAALIAFNDFHQFTPEEIARGEQVADQIALAVANAKLVTELQASEARYRDIFESVGVPLYEEDFSATIAAIDDLKAQGVPDLRRYLNDHPEFVSQAAQTIRILDVNRAALRMLDAESKEDVLGSLETVIVPETLETLSDHLVAIAEGQLFFQGETVNRTLQGELRRVLLTMAIPSRAEGFERVVVSTVDITEREELEEKLRRQEKLAAIGGLAGGIAHDFNTLLTSIIITAEMELHRAGLHPHTRTALETILAESRRAGDLVQQIMDFSRSAMIDPRPVSLVDLVGDGVTEGAAALLSRTIPEHIEIVTELSAHPCVVRADPGRIHQVLMNLASNARDAMPDGGELQISVSPTRFSKEEERPLPDMPAGAWACLSVADTGTGMSDEAQAHLFEPFFTTKEVGEGTGLGLAQVYGIVKQHEGYIQVDTAAGAGTTVTIYLPLAGSPEEEPTADPEDAAADGAGETILVVEDAAPLQQAIEAALESLGYRVIAASTGREALERVPLEEVDLVLTDVVMPEMGGQALLRELQVQAPGLPVIAMTGHVMDMDVEELEAAGFAGGLLKPFSIDELQAVLRDAGGGADTQGA